MRPCGLKGDEAIGCAGRSTMISLAVMRTRGTRSRMNPALRVGRAGVMMRAPGVRVRKFQE
eukprot:10590755-Heterocapsa_arctica.AAC.1